MNRFNLVDSIVLINEEGRDPFQKRKINAGPSIIKICGF